MADQQGPATDANGYITSGRFAGHHVSNLAQYAESLENAVQGDPPTPPTASTEQPADSAQQASPQDRLAAHSGTRISSINDAASTRLEADDEAEFRKELSDHGVNYDDWKEKVDIIKNGMNGQMRVQKGVHRLIYTQLRSQEPDSFARLHGQQVVGEVATEDDEVEETVEETQTAAGVNEEIKEQAPKPKAQAVGGSVAPTPASRTTGKKKDQKIPLQATAKVERLASEWGMTTEEYLKRIHTRGVTQDDIERESVTRAERPGRMKSVFDRSTATS